MAVATPGTFHALRGLLFATEEPNTYLCRFLTTCMEGSKMILLLMGAPGAGKGTQAEVLRDTLHMAHVSSGDLFRLHIKNGTSLGQEAKAYMDRGFLVPDAITVGMILARLDEPDTANGVILDGFPRTVAQAEALDTALRREGKRVDLALFIVVPNEDLVDRLSGRWICPADGAVYH